MGEALDIPEIDVCAACARLYSRAGGIALCRSCSEDEGARAALVRDHVLEHGAPTLAEVSRATGIGRLELRMMVSSGRFPLLRRGLDIGSCTCAFEPEGRCPHCRRALASRFRQHEERRERHG